VLFLYGLYEDYSFQNKKDYTVKTLETKRLIIREWEESDAADLFEFCNNSDIVNTGWNIHTNI
jgi:RimJ/RimL family protein N-acetyltransferase